MKAIIRKIHKDGKTRLGTEGNTVTRDYQTNRALYRYAIAPALRRHKIIRVEIYTGSVLAEPKEVREYTEVIDGPPSLAERINRIK